MGGGRGREVLMMFEDGDDRVVGGKGEGERK